MASSGKKKTTFAKLARESRLRERRLDKAARKDARKRAAEFPDPPVAEGLDGEETWQDGEVRDPDQAGVVESGETPATGADQTAAPEPDQG
jgi:hypothetical protein